MGAERVSEFLFEAARDSQGEIVEVGSWMGAGTLWLARGAKVGHKRVHAYDRWKVSTQEAQKAKKWSFELKPGDNSLPLVKELLGDESRFVCFHQTEISQATWHGDPIGLYVDDAAKLSPDFQKVLSVFSPFWTEGCVLLMMDFHYYVKAGPKYRYQYEVFSSFPESFSPVSLPTTASPSHAAFKFSRGTGAFSRWAESL